MVICRSDKGITAWLEDESDGFRGRGRFLAGIKICETGTLEGLDYAKGRRYEVRSQNLVAVGVGREVIHRVWRRGASYYSTRTCVLVMEGR